MHVLAETTLIEPTLAGESDRTSRTAERAACFHCGLPCLDSSFTSGPKSFCCNGCLTVHDILSSNGLGFFYELTAAPGIKQKSKPRHEQWRYLDEPRLRQKLLDYTDDKQSRVTFYLPAIHCIACVWLLENLFRLHPGVARSSVNFQKREASIQFAPDKIKLSEIAVLLTSIGYEPTLTLGELEKSTTKPPKKRQWLQIGVAGFAFGNIMLFSLPTYFGLDSLSAPIFKNIFSWLSLVIALPVLFFSASDYWKSAWVSIRQRVLTLDVPIAAGLAALYLQSTYAVILGRGEYYLDSMTGLIFFLLCGRMFQQKTHERLAFDRDYKSFFPLSVTRRSGDREEQASISQLSVGDTIVVRNGELVPADARLISGAALIDYSFVTGESEPIAKVEGDYLYAGGKQIGPAIEMQTVKAVSQSYLTSLWNHETFQKDRDDNLNTLTNRYSRRFTMIVVVIAIGSALFWTVTGDWPRGLKAFTSVLIVACPCALALAAPFTLGTTQRLLGRLKVFLKNALVLERMARVDTIVFDKTGTLTANSDKVSFSNTSLTSTEENWIASLTRQSTHPHSVRITESLSEKCTFLPVKRFTEAPGYGLEGEVQGHTVWIGSRAWLKKHNADSTTAGAANGNSVHVAIDGQYRGAFTLSSALRPDTENLLRKLTAHYEIALLSGDNERERERFLHLFGSTPNLNFNQSPLDKLGFIKRLQESGKVVMMVGDGLNDAGALKQSEVGVAVVENVGTFSPASDVILSATAVPQLYMILSLARRSAWIVRTSFLVSACYNLIGVSIAAAGWLSPLVCAVLMPASSISVVVFACGMSLWAARRTLGKVEVTQ